MIEVKGLVKKYGDHIAVDQLSFTVEKGQVLGFLGPNGAGKSTTMNMITGYISATEGTVIIDGHDIFEEPEEAKKAIGYLPEIPPLYPDMTVIEYLRFVAELKGLAKEERERAMESVMERTKIVEMKKRLIKQLSKGYKQRVGLAGAMLGDPEVLILDEPTVGLDPAQIIEIRDLIKELSAEHTVVLSSHILSEVSAVCDRVMIINKGKLIVSDTPERLSEGMMNTNSIHLLVKGDMEQVDEILAPMEEVTGVEYEDTTEEGKLKFTVNYEGKQDIREKLFYGFAEAKCPIFDMRQTTMSLEDVFLELTKEDGEAVSSSSQEVKEIEEKEEEENESDL